MKKVIKSRSFLKWAGGKYSLVDQIQKHLPSGERLVEPFAGAANVFLNTNYKEYWLNDINKDLIDLYKLIQRDHKAFIKAAKTLFVPENNNKEAFLQLRAEFNEAASGLRRSAIFLYLNKHCFNGLCRYNSKGLFNVPFGKYSSVKFPEKEIEIFAEKSQKAKFTCLPFEKVFSQIKNGDVVYCDPPYAPISKTALFTSYSTGGFDNKAQEQLAKCAEKCSGTVASVLISNHDLEITREWYVNAKISMIKAARVINSKGTGRSKVSELFALFAFSPHKL